MADLAGVRLVVFRVENLTCAAEAATVREILTALPATNLEVDPLFVGYYRDAGRTWERQAWIKASPLAGDLALGCMLDSAASIAADIAEVLSEGRE